MIGVRTIARMLGDVLGRGHVAAQDNFFQIGGDSVRAVMVVARLIKICEKRGICDPGLEGRLLNTIFEIGTSQALAAVIAAPPSQSKLDLPLQVVERVGDFPASFAQVRLWLPSRLHAANPAYNIAAIRRIYGDFDEAVFRFALQELTKRHEPLRTTLREVQGDLIQRIHPDPQIEWSVPDTADQTASGDAEASAREWYTCLGKRPFDLVAGPVVRAGVFPLSSSERFIVLVLSHVAADGWSMALLFEELSELYEAHRVGRPPELRPLSVQYADYSVWQHARLARGLLEMEQRYWTTQLAGAPEVLELAPWKLRPTMDDSRGATFTFRFGRQRHAGVRAFAARECTTPHVVCLAAFQALLHRYTGRDDLLVGAPFAGRTRSELEPLIGFFANTVILRSRIESETTFKQLVRTAHRIVAEAVQNQEVPFEVVVSALRPYRDIRWTPFVQVMFIYQNTPQGSLHFETAKVDEVLLDIGTAKFDLTAELIEMEDDTECRLEYRLALLDLEWIHSFASRYSLFLDQIVETPDASISSLAILTPAERELLAPLGPPPMRIEDDLWNYFVEAAARRPDAPAIVTSTCAHTFSELLRRAEENAARLADLGIGLGDLVAVQGARGFETTAALLAVLCRRASYCPLALDGPSERRARVLRHARPGVSISIESNGKAQIEPTELISPARLPPEAAYILYTSGSTGEPKGVVGTRAGILNRLRWMWASWPFDGEEISCHRVPLTFVDAIWDVFGPLLAGTPIAVAPPEADRDVRALVRFLAFSKSTRITLVPALLSVVLEVLHSLQETLPRLRLWICSGEALPEPLAARFHEQLPGRTLLNLYGCTECAGDSTYHVVEPGLNGRVPIGRPLPGNTIRILDRAGLPVVPGTPGEIYIGGIGVALGYHDASAETARRFIEEGSPKERWFRTFDIGRLRPDRSLEFLGRADSEISIRGFRLDTEAVRACLLSHPWIRDAAVLPIENTNGELSLVAYLVTSTSVGSRIPMLRSYAATRLPGPMVPARFIVVSELPRTPHGKLDRASLPAPGAEGHGTEPRNETERRIASIWTDVLGGHRLGINEDFFEVGGDSLAANRVVARIESLFDVDIPLPLFYQRPTIAALAERVLEAEISRAEAETLAEVLRSMSTNGPDGRDDTSEP